MDKGKAGHPHFPKAPSLTARGSGLIAPPAFRPMASPVRPAVVQRRISINGTPQVAVPPITERLDADVPGNTVTTHASYARIVGDMITDDTPRTLATGAWGRGHSTNLVRAIQSVIDNEAQAAAAAAALQAAQAANALKDGFGSIADWNTLRAAGHAAQISHSHDGAEPKPGHQHAHVACYDIVWTRSTGNTTKWCLHIHYFNANKVAANVESAHFKRMKNHAAGNNGAEITGDRAHSLLSNQAPIA